jgi:hypothetical protein
MAEARDGRGDRAIQAILAFPSNYVKNSKRKERLLLEAAP